MKTKKLFLMAAMLLMSVGAFAQSGNSLKGDVNGDGVVDVADVVAVLKIMKEGGGTASTYDYYLGLATVEQIQDQNYINGLSYNTVGVKPTELTMPAGYNVMIYPSSWGTPKITDDMGFELPPYSVDDLGITNPPGKIVIVEEMSANNTHCNFSWK